jgi:hypothetical protein
MCFLGVAWTLLSLLLVVQTFNGDDTKGFVWRGLLQSSFRPMLHQRWKTPTTDSSFLIEGTYSLTNMYNACHAGKVLESRRPPLTPYFSIAHHDAGWVDSTGFVYVTFSTATFSPPLASFRSW